MNLRKITLKYMGWCPGTEDASKFRRMIWKSAVTHFPHVTIFFIPIFSLSLSIFMIGLRGLQQLLFGGAHAVSGSLRLLSVLLLCFLVYFCISFYKKSQTTSFDIKAMVSLTFGFYALFNLHEGIIEIPSVFNFAYNLDAFRNLPSILVYSLSVIFSFSLFKLSTIIMERDSLDTGFLRIIVLCLAAYGFSGLIDFIISPFGWDFYFYGFIYRSLHDLIIWVSHFGSFMGYVIILFLALDVLRNRGIRKESVYTAFLAFGIAWLVRDVSAFVVNIFWSPIYSNLFDLSILSFFGIIPIILSYIPVIGVSYSLMNGGSWGGRNLKRSIVAVFLYVSGNLFRYILGIFSCLSLMTQPVNIWTSVVRISRITIFLPFLISLLALGLWLYRKRIQVNVDPLKIPLSRARDVIVNG